MAEKINFTGKELSYLQDRDFLTTKFQIIDKLHKLFARVEERLKAEVESTDFQFPEAAFVRAGKVSQGENYKNLPYMVLDYPRIFSKNDVFSFRVIFWWGHYLSVSLHLKGRSLEKYRQALLHQLRSQPGDLYLCVHSTPWEYHFSEDNYRLLSDFKVDELERTLSEKEFIKLAKKADLQKWEELPDLSAACFREFLGYLT